MSARRAGAKFCAGAAVAFWLSFALLPLLVALRPIDPLACCRLNGSHRCFMRARGPAGGLALRSDAKVCATASARAITAQVAVLASRSSLRNRVQPVSLVCASSRVAPHVFSNRSASRAPPVV
ncbi:MAG: hypothetical protein JWO97_1833 [Acidobacteria bacterium]|nr:hypothetical protein [Acidobacteriota bacterium]